MSDTNRRDDRPDQPPESNFSADLARLKQSLGGYGGFIVLGVLVAGGACVLLMGFGG